MVGRKTKSRIALGVAVTFLGGAVALALMALNFIKAENPSPSPNANKTTNEGTSDAQSEWPEVDWDYWLSVNSDIVAWITVPNTEINHPVVQAHASNPDYYLHHDVYGNYNPLGALYLDADCEQDGLNSQNAVILGHHWEGLTQTGCFNVIADYKDKDYANAHSVVLIQTPTEKLKYEVRYANIVKGSEPNKRVSFVDATDFSQWYEENLNSAAMVLDGESRPNQTISLVSCSYNYWKENERTVVVTSNAYVSQAVTVNKEE